MVKRREVGESGVVNNADDETGIERRERQDAMEQAGALRGLMRWFGWLALVVSVILGGVIFCLVWNQQERGGLIWIALAGMMVLAAVSGLCWQMRRDLKE